MCTSGVDVESVFLVVQCVCAVLRTDLGGHAVHTSGVDVESVCMVVQSVCTLWTDLRGLAVCTSGADVPQRPRPLSSPPGVVADCPETE